MTTPHLCAIAILAVICVVTSAFSLSQNLQVEGNFRLSFERSLSK